MIRFCECETYTTADQNFQEECLTLDKTIWQRGRAYFLKNRGAQTVSVVDEQHTSVCLAWQDREARREIRMLRELQECKGALNFHDLHPECKEVTIHGCNELAWYMREYLIACGIKVRVDGKYWRELGVEEEKSRVSASQHYEIYAEGVHQKSSDWKKERLRSASVEFECVDEIYEANIKAGKISDHYSDSYGLLEKLRAEHSVVIRGTGTKAQDAYDWLLANGIDVCAFQSGKAGEERECLFGKPILRRKQIEEKYKDAVIIECASKYSAWGFGDVNDYDYEGYERNKRYFLLRDYVEVPESNLFHICEGRELVFIGDIYLCGRAYEWFTLHGIHKDQIKYWDILEEYKKETEKCKMPAIDARELAGRTDFLCFIIAPQYAVEGVVTRETANKRIVYMDNLKVHGVRDYTDYFSDMSRFIHLETETVKYPRKELRPAGILLGAIEAFSGNVLVKQSMSGHPQIIIIEGGNKGAYLDIGLYCLCIRLAEIKSGDILAAFWELYRNEAVKEALGRDFTDLERFNNKMEELLRLSNRFTSQELFVMFHLAFVAMHGREVSDIGNSIIYWEPHCWDRNVVREWARWLGSEDVRGYTLSVARNKYICSGSAIRTLSELKWQNVVGCMYNGAFVSQKRFAYWEERTLKFEELKCHPREEMGALCDWLGISFDEALMETTFLGEKAYFGTITGFDTKPAYNLYEEYFSIFDRMRIAMAAGYFQKKYEYPYVSCMEFSRRELQEMYLKKFRWEKQAEGSNKDEKLYFGVQKIVWYWLWLNRFAEIMQIELTERY